MRYTYTSAETEGIPCYMICKGAAWPEPGFEREVGRVYWEEDAQLFVAILNLQAMWGGHVDYLAVLNVVMAQLRGDTP